MGYYIIEEESCQILHEGEITSEPEAIETAQELLRAHNSAGPFFIVKKVSSVEQVNEISVKHFK